MSSATNTSTKPLHGNPNTAIEASRQTSNVSKPSQVQNKNDKGRQTQPTQLQKALQFLGEQWFLIALGILIAIASQVQVPLGQQKLKQTVVSYLCISIIFFSTGCTLDTKILLKNYGRWKLHLFAQFQCFIMTSAIVFGVVSAVATSRFMDAGLLIGMIFFGCVATTISSNVIMTRQAHGNVALTVVQTTVGNFLGVFITPALVVMYTSVPTWYNAVLPPTSGQFAVIYRATLMKLGLSIYLPLAVGQVARYLFPKTIKKVFVDWKLSKIGSVCLLGLLWSAYDQAFASHAFEGVEASNKIFIVFISVAFWIVSFLISFYSSLIWLPREDVVAICYCVPAKAITMGVPLSTTIFTNIDLGLESRIQIPIVIYQGLQLAFGSILVPIFRRWIDRKTAQDAEPGDTVENGTSNNYNNNEKAEDT